MKNLELVCRAAVAVCVAYFIGALLWLWSTFPYVEYWYSKIAQCGRLEKLLFKFYCFDWCAGLVAIFTALSLFQNRGFEKYKLPRIVPVCIGALAGGTILLLAGDLLRRFLTVPAIDWYPNHPNWLTYALNFIILAAGVISVLFIKKQR